MQKLHKVPGEELPYEVVRGRAAIYGLFLDDIIRIFGSVFQNRVIILGILAGSQRFVILIREFSY